MMRWQTSLMSADPDNGVSGGPGAEFENEADLAAKLAELKDLRPLQRICDC